MLDSVKLIDIHEHNRTDVQAAFMSRFEKFT